MRPDEVILPNGMCWDEARRQIYFVDSGAETITAYPTDDQATAGDCCCDSGGRWPLGGDGGL